mmetsp:Transcript_14337/g.17173  ORF Transcript_14337/g.17173 Transcript_14337/m.17173 type:complete len:214 (+) Transcript_14337:608-1249(+)
MEKLLNARRLFQKEGWIMTEADIHMVNIIPMGDLPMEEAMAMADVEVVMDMEEDTEMVDTEMVGMEMAGTGITKMEGVVRGMITQVLTLRRTTTGDSKDNMVATRATTPDMEEIIKAMGRNARVDTRETMVVQTAMEEGMEGILVGMDAGEEEEEEEEVAMTAHTIPTAEDRVDFLKTKNGHNIAFQIQLSMVKSTKLLYTPHTKSCFKGVDC